MRDVKGTDDLIYVSSVEQEEPNFKYLNNVFLQENTARSVEKGNTAISVLFTSCLALQSYSLSTFMSND